MLSRPGSRDSHGASPNALLAVQAEHVTGRDVDLDTKRKSKPYTKPGPFLFINASLETASRARSLKVTAEIKQHLSRRQKAQSGRKLLRLDSSTSKILSSDEDDETDDEADDASPLPQSTKCHQTDTSVHHSAATHMEKVRSHDPLNAFAVNNTVLDPFTDSAPFSRETSRLLFLYCQHLVPLAATVSPEWNWNANIPQIQSSQMLSNAIAAYAGAFFPGIRDGARSVVVPPLPDKGKTSLWPMPTWFLYHNKALTLLNEALSDIAQASRVDVFHTILFLVRIAVLLGDGPTANMHFKALRQVALVQGIDWTTLNQEMAVARVNFPTLFLYKAAMVKTRQAQVTEEYPSFVIEPDRRQWTDDREWIKFSGMLYGRSLTWHAKAPSAVPQYEAQDQMLRIDPEILQLPNNTQCSLLHHYQLALYLWSYLTGICYDTGLPKIKLHVEELERFLRTTDLTLLEYHAPKVTFILYLCGTFATRGQRLRSWFIQKLSNAQIQVHYMRDIYTQLEGFNDPVQCNTVLLEEILIEIRQLRHGVKSVSRRDLYPGRPYRSKHGQIPLSYEPDLSTSIPDA